MDNSAAIAIRPVRAGDHAAVSALSPRLTTGVAPWRDPAKVAQAARGWVESSLGAAGQGGHAVLVAELDGKVVGMVSLAVRTHFTGETDAYIGELITDRAAEGRGAGRALLAAAEQWAAEHGFARVTLETGTRNDRALRLYERAGYLTEEVRLTKTLESRPAGDTARSE
jgi:ribosomal protein S18 acetylase RimI-like enzyme